MNEKPPLLWRVDPLAEAHFKLPVSAALHREAGKRGFSCIPKFSYTSRAYYAEILKLEHQFNGGWRTWPNFRMGTGPTPLEAAIDGYLKCMPDDPVMLMFNLEIQATLLAQDVRSIAKLETALEDLTDLVRSYNVPIVEEPAYPQVRVRAYNSAIDDPRGRPADDIAALAASNDEDDDL